MTENIETGVLWSAYPLEQDVIAQIEDKFSELLGRRVKLDVKIKPEIIGGIIVTIGDKEYDGSVYGQLNRMKNHLLGLKKGDIANMGVSVRTEDDAGMQSIGNLLAVRSGNTARKPASRISVM